MLGPSRLLTLTRKSKFSKQTCLTQFFEYIPILGPVSSFEAQKLCKRSISKKVDFCANIDQKSKFSKWTCPTQFFEYIPILGPISSFEAQKLCKRPISEKVDFYADVDQMSKFLRWTYLAQFFEYIPIFESVPSFETWKLQKWLNSKCSKLRSSRTKFEIHPFNWDPRRVILQIPSRLALQSTNELSQVCLKITLGH